MLCFHVETRTSLCIELHVQSRLGLGVGVGGWGGKDPSHALKPGQLKFRELSALPHCSSVFLSVPLGVKSPGPGTSELPGPEGDVHLLLWLPTGGHTEMTPDWPAAGAETTRASEGAVCRGLHRACAGRLCEWGRRAGWTE